MVIQINKYVAEIENNSVLVLPCHPRARFKEPQRVTFAEVFALRPNYVRDVVSRKVRYTGLLYLIHFDRPYKHAKHYLGFTNNLDRRMLEHSAGRGARLMQVIEEANIGWQIARVWYGDRYEERRLKKHSSSRYCPICQLLERSESGAALQV